MPVLTGRPGTIGGQAVSGIAGRLFLPGRSSGGPRPGGVGIVPMSVDDFRFGRRNHRLDFPNDWVDRRRRRLVGRLVERFLAHEVYLKPISLDQRLLVWGDVDCCFLHIRRPGRWRRREFGNPAHRHSAERNQTQSREPHCSDHRTIPPPTLRSRLKIDSGG